jgi:hypothetical protein
MKTQHSILPLKANNSTKKDLNDSKLGEISNNKLKRARKRMN